MQRKYQDQVNDVRSDLGALSVHSAGAHVTKWESAAAGELIFVSAKSGFGTGVPIRGGIPLCFPWFGIPSTWQDDVPLLGGGLASGKHGFARMVAWQPVVDFEDEDGGCTLTYELTEKYLQEQGYEGVQPFFAVYRVEFNGTSLELTFAVANTGNEAFRFECAIHTYFLVGDVRKALVTGLEGVEYADKVAKGELKVQSGPISFGSEVDRVFHFSGPVELIDPGRNHRVRIAKAGSGTTVVWNPGPEAAASIPDLAEGQWRDFVCVETANTGPSALVLQPGQTHTMRTRYEVETLGL